MKIEGAEDWRVMVTVIGPNGQSTAKEKRVGVHATVAGGDPATLRGEIRSVAEGLARDVFNDIVFIHFGGVAAVRDMQGKD